MELVVEMRGEFVASKFAAPSSHQQPGATRTDDTPVPIALQVGQHANGPGFGELFCR